MNNILQDSLRCGEMAGMRGNNANTKRPSR